MSEPGSATGLSRRLAAHLAAVRHSPPSPSALRAASRSLMDAWGVSLAASGLGERVDAFHDLAVEGGRGPCLLIGRGSGATPLLAALANGALAHAVDYEDVLDGAPIHPNAATVPAAMAAAALRERCDGETLLAAIAAGCDLVCRLGLALRVNPDDFGFYPPPILGAFGAAAAAAVVLELDAEATLSALALTLAQSTATAQFKQSPRSDVRAVRDAFAAQAGLMAALLARKGVVGFEAPLEGRAGLFALYARGAYDPETVVADLGERWWGEAVSYKLWPSCRGTHAAIEAALNLRRRLALDPRDVTAVEVQGPPIQRMLAEPVAQKRAPHRAIDAKFSLPFAVAVALVHGEVGLPHFAPEALRDPAVLALAGKVAFVEDAAFADASAGGLTLHLGGAAHSLRIDRPLGHPDHPLSDADLERKFRDCARYAAVPPDGAALERLIDQLHGAAELRDLNATLLALPAGA